jgi:hypothetical protein
MARSTPPRARPREATCGNYGGDPDSPGDDDDVRVSLFLVLQTMTEVLALDHVEG